MEIARYRRAGLIAAAAISMNLVCGYLGSVDTCGSDKDALCREGSRHDHIMNVLNERRTGLTLAEEVRLAETIVAESRNYDLDPLFVAAMIDTESSFYNWSKSNRGAVGLMQIMPRTALEFTDELKIKWRGEATLYDPYTNVRLGLKYYSELLDMYGGDERKALAAYSCGPPCVDARINSGAGVPRQYPSKVFSSYAAMRGETVF